MSSEHLALRQDFYELLTEHHSLAPGYSTSLANELVHLVVLHGYLPETPVHQSRAGGEVAP